MQRNSADHSIYRLHTCKQRALAFKKVKMIVSAFASLFYTRGSYRNSALFLGLHNTFSGFLLNEQIDELYV